MTSVHFSLPPVLLFICFCKIIAYLNDRAGSLRGTTIVIHLLRLYFEVKLSFEVKPEAPVRCHVSTDASLTN